LETEITNLLEVGMDNLQQRMAEVCFIFVMLNGIRDAFELEHDVEISTKFIGVARGDCKNRKQDHSFM
jgi:hypothetical protein